MKGAVSNFLIALLMFFAFTACSKQPAREINSAKTAVDSAMAEGAEKYSPAEARKVNDELAAALAEVNAQDARFSKDYKRAKGLLAKVNADAEALKAGLAAKKEEARKQALAAQEAATTAVDEAKTLVAKAARSNKADGGLDALNAAARGLDEALLEVKNLITTEDYITAMEKAGAVKADASALSEKVKQATVEQAPKKKVTKIKKRH
jgi:hypothetical protein